MRARGQPSAGKLRIWGRSRSAKACRIGDPWKRFRRADTSLRVEGKRCRLARRGDLALALASGRPAPGRQSSYPSRTQLTNLPNTQILTADQEYVCSHVAKSLDLQALHAGGGTRTPDTRIMIGWRQGAEGSDRHSQARRGDLSSLGSRELGAKSGAKSRRKRKRRRQADS
jgi:hypothetical protein